VIGRISIAFAAFAALAGGSSVAAQNLPPLSYEVVRNRADTQFDAAKAYVLIETGLWADIELVKQATADERELWERDRHAALAKAQAEWPTLLAEYERQRVRDARGRATRESAPRPIEPTDANFPWPAAEAQLRVMMSVLRRFSTEDGVALFVYEVPPGTYSLYAYNNIVMRDCLCMGSVSFPVAAGAITALRVDRKFLGTKGEVLSERPRGVSDMERWMRSGIAVSGHTAAAYHPRIPRAMIRPAQLSPVPELANWGGYIVNRLLPVPGLFHYEFEKMVDERPVAD
jgi:hypothetical protein